MGSPRDNPYKEYSIQAGLGKLGQISDWAVMDIQRSESLWVTNIFTTTIGDLMTGNGWMADVLPGDVLPGDVLPGDVLPGDVLPGDVLPGDVLPGDVLPGDVLPGDVLPGDVLPGDAAKAK